MPDPTETSPAQPQGQPAEGSGAAASLAAGADATNAAESQPSPEEIARWRSLEAKFKEQNVDPEQLLPEFTRTRQSEKALADEAAQWRSFFQQQSQQRAAQADPAETLVSQIAEAESIGDRATAERLRRQLIREESRQVAREEHQKLSLQERSQTQASAIKDRAARYGISPSEAEALAQRLPQSPEAMALALAYVRDPSKVEDAILSEREKRKKAADEATRFRSIVDTGGRNPGLGARQEEDADATFDIPESLYFGYPESYWKKQLGDRFSRVRLVRHDGSPVRTA